MAGLRGRRQAIHEKRERLGGKLYEGKEDKSDGRGGRWEKTALVSWHWAETWGTQRRETWMYGEETHRHWKDQGPKSWRRRVLGQTLPFENFAYSSHWCWSRAKKLSGFNSRATRECVPWLEHGCSVERAVFGSQLCSESPSLWASVSLFSRAMPPLAGPPPGMLSEIKNMKILSELKHAWGG